MYRGFIEEIGEVAKNDEDARDPGTARVRAARPGGSVALAGVCLSAGAVGGRRVARGRVERDRAPLDLGRARRRARRVNVELPIPAGDAIEGHLVQGHVDGDRQGAAHRRGAASDAALDPSAGALRSSRWSPKASVTVDGVSLTVAEVCATASRSRSCPRRWRAPRSPPWSRARASTSSSICSTSWPAATRAGTRSAPAGRRGASLGGRRDRPARRREGRRADRGAVAAPSSSTRIARARAT